MDRLFQTERGDIALILLDEDEGPVLEVTYNTVPGGVGTVRMRKDFANTEEGWQAARGVFEGFDEVRSLACSWAIKAWLSHVFR